jgi:hypothetical protein
LRDLQYVTDHDEATLHFDVKIPSSGGYYRKNSRREPLARPGSEGHQAA